MSDITFDYDQDCWRLGRYLPKPTWRQLVKECHWIYLREHGLTATHDPHAVERAQLLGLTLDSAAELELGIRRQLIAAASATSGAKIYDARLMAFQQLGVEWLLSHDYALLADEPGLGKTVQALIAVREADISPVYIVCPPIVMSVWERHVVDWRGPVDIRIGGKQQGTLEMMADVVIVPWSRIAQMRAPSKIPLLILDESHYMKSASARRSKAALEWAKGAKRVWLLSGTPMPNHPSELWMQLRALRVAPSEKLFSAWYYPWGKRSARGAADLSAWLKTHVMMRRLKRDVLSQLPPKIRRVVPVAAPRGSAQLVREEARLYDRRHQGADVLGELVRIRAELGRAKIPYAIDLVSDRLGSGPIVIYAHHQAVVKQLASRLSCPYIMGDTPHHERAKIVAEFQDGQHQAIVCSITAAGVGITLTAARYALVVEPDWVPGVNIQAEDRLHRIGQAEPVEVDYLVWDDKNSVDWRVVQAILRKDRTISSTIGQSQPLEELGVL